MQKTIANIFAKAGEDVFLTNTFALAFKLYNF